MLGVGIVGMYLSAPGQSFSVAVFIDPMLVDLGLARSSYSGAYLFAGLCGGLLLPVIGRLLDRYGARRMLPALGLLLGFACVWMSSTRSLGGLYLGFTMIRCIGQGALTLTATWLVGEWFQKRRGLAMGLVGLGGTLSVMTIPQLNDLLISEVGWRSTWWVLAGLVWVGLILPSLLLIRDRPEDLGLLPDARWPGDAAAAGRPGEATAEAAERPEIEQSWQVGEAMRMSSFWKLLAVLATTSLVGTGLIFHQISLLGVHGVSRKTALLLLAGQAVVGSVVSILAGWLTDRWPERYLLAASMLFLAVGVILLLWLPSPGWVIAYVVALGLQGGIIRSTGTAVWINYYGRRCQGAIRGAAMAVLVVAAACGPLPLALSWDLLGSYDAALAVFAVMPFVAGVVVLTAKPPQAQES